MTQTLVPQQDDNKAASSNNNRFRMNVQMGVILAVVLALVAGLAIAAQDKYSAKVPGGLAMSEFRGYEDWKAISISRNERVVAMLLGIPAMIAAYSDSIA